MVTGLEVPILKSAVADAPDDFESRLERALPQLSRLTVLVPEKHDLVLMKAMRCYEHDLEAIVQIHANSPLDLEILIRRFKNEMAPIGDPTRIRRNVLVVVEHLFPDRVDSVAQRLR